MRKSLLFAFSAFLIVGCIPKSPTKYVYEATYAVKLASVERPKETKDRWGESEEIKLSADNKYSFQDSLIASFFMVSKDRVSFEIRNQTDNSIKIVWDESAFINIDGSSERVMHSGVKYTEMSNSHPSTVIAAHGHITDMIIPTSRIYYDEGIYTRYYTKKASWKHHNLLSPYLDILEQLPGEPEPIEVSAEFQNAVKEVVGKNFGILLPIEIQGVVNEYTLWFEIMDFNISEPILLYTYLGY